MLLTVLFANDKRPCARLALMEFDPEQLEAKMGAALHAISKRHAELNGSADHHEECIL